MNGTSGLYVYVSTHTVTPETPNAQFLVFHSSPFTVYLNLRHVAPGTPRNPGSYGPPTSASWGAHTRLTENVHSHLAFHL